MKLTNKTILITGGSSGIGFELARQLLARGNTVIVTGRDQARLAAAAHTLPGLHVIQSDVSDPDAIQHLHATVLAQFPLLDVLINNAGIMRNLDLNLPRALDVVTREIEVNLGGPVRMIQQFLPHLKGRPESAIVNVSSGLAFVPMPISPVYCATKAALHSLSLSLRVQLQGTSVHVFELAPPLTDTPLYRDEFPAEAKKMSGMDATALVRLTIAGIEAGKHEIRPGLSNVLKWMSRIAPHFMLGQLAKVGRTAAA